MKNIFKLLSIVTVLFSIISCETYKVKDPDMSAVADFDGRWVCFAYDQSDLANPETVFVVEITNTTFDEADRFWMTVTDCNPYYVLVNDKYYYPFCDALRLDVECENSSLTFHCEDISAEQPRTSYNIYFEQGYYTYAYYTGEMPMTGYKVTIADGKITKDGIDTYSGYKADAIEFNYTRTDPDGSVYNYVVKGMKNTGWAEDMVDYADFIEENF